MQVIYIKEDKFQYDIHSLYKAFYPDQDVRVIIGEKGTVPEKETDISPDDEISFIDVNRDKNDLKRTLYRDLSEKTGKILPWGDLTGIRPTRIAMNLIDEGLGDEQIRSYMMDTYLVSEEKTDLAIDIARREKRILADIDY